MRTNIVLDTHLLETAFRYTQAKTKRELVDIALREFVENHQRRDVRDLVGKVRLHADYNYKTSRNREEK